MQVWRIGMLTVAVLGTALQATLMADDSREESPATKAAKSEDSPSAAAAPGKDGNGSSESKPALSKRDQAALEAEFSKKLSGAALVGTFSIQGRDGARTERYEIASATKLFGNDWIITARIKYGDKDLSLPVPVKVYWADDTPVISLTDLTLPALGTFTSRVMIYGDRYAGTWQHDAVGGHMWGMVEKAAARSDADSSTKKPGTESQPGQ